MTNHTAAQPLDLDKLEALARAATPGPWDVIQASAMKNGRIVVDELYVYSPEACNVAIAADIADPATGEMSEANAAFISAFNPKTAIVLIAKARAAQPASSNEQIATVILHLIGEGAMDWKAGPTGNDEEDAFNSDSEELNTLVHLVNRVRAAQPESATGTTGASIPTWQERYDEMGKGPSSNDKLVAMMAEIADLRAKLVHSDESVAQYQQNVQELAEELRAACSQLAAKGQGELVGEVIEGPTVGMGIPTREARLIGSRAKVGDKLYLAAPASAQPADAGCKWPTCQPEEVQQQVADQAYRELYSGAQPADAEQLDEALANFLAEHTCLNQDGIDTHAVKMVLALNYAALCPVPEEEINEWREQGYLPEGSAQPDRGAAQELVDLLKAIRPQYGAVGSRDVDVAAQQNRIDRAVELLELDAKSPVAYVNGDELDNMLDDRTATVQSNPSGWRRTPLYRAPVPALLAADGLITDPKAKGYRPPFCDNGIDGSKCCNFGCAANRELAVEAAQGPDSHRRGKAYLLRPNTWDKTSYEACDGRWEGWQWRAALGQSPATSAADAKDAARLAYCVAHGFPQCLSSGWWAPLPNGHLIGVRGSGPIEAIDAAMAAAPSSAKGGDECAAHHEGHRFGPHGYNGERQCEWCGAKGCDV